MTFNQFFETQLVQHGMWPKDVPAVMQAVYDDPANKAMQGRWNEDISAYPSVMKLIGWISVKHHALTWIDTNCPNAWYRGMFVD